MDLAESPGHRLPSEKRHPWEEVRFEFILKLIEQSPTLQEGDIILDVGCGDAYITERLAAQYPDSFFYAVDPGFTDESIARHRAAAGKNLYFCTSMAEVIVGLQGKTTTLILLTDVIEHIEDDAAFLRSLCNGSFCNEATHMLITVPAFSSLFTSRDKALGHYRRYTNSTLRSLVQQCGLDVLSHGYFFLSLLGARLLRVIGERVFRSKTSAESDLLTWNGGPMSTRTARMLLRADLVTTRMLRKIGLNPVGLSNYCICKPYPHG